MDLLLEIYTDAWSETWGYVPVSRRQARKLADDLRLIADPSLVMFAEVDGETAGMVVGLPNLNEAIRDFNGFIDPIKAVKLIWRLKVRGLESGRILLFGVKRKFQRRRELIGLPFVLLHELYLRAKRSATPGAKRAGCWKTTPASTPSCRTGTPTSTSATASTRSR